MLIDRERELDELDAVLRAPSARLLAVSGRRRLGKTTLLVHWARTSQHPSLYWVSSRLPSSLLLQQFSQQVWQHGHPGERAPRTFSYEDWSTRTHCPFPSNGSGRTGEATHRWTSPPSTGETRRCCWERPSGARRLWDGAWSGS